MIEKSSIECISHVYLVKMINCDLSNTGQPFSKNAVTISKSQ